MTRQLAFIPVGTGDTYANFIQSVSSRHNRIYWGGSSVPLRAGTKLSKFKRTVFDRLKVGDVVMFVHKGSTDTVGVVVDLRHNTTEAHTIGWLPGDRPWDLIIEMEKVPLRVPRVMDLISYKGTPNSSCLVKHTKCDGFWNLHGAQFANYAVGAPQPIAVRNSVAATRKKTYRSEVDRHSEQSWERHREQIDPQGVGRSVQYPLDHMYSVACGEAVGVPSFIIGSRHNLALLLETENASKGARCSQSLADLLVHFPGYDHLLEVDRTLTQQGKMPWQHGTTA